MRITATFPFCSAELANDPPAQFEKIRLVLSGSSRTLLEVPFERFGELWTPWAIPFLHPAHVSIEFVNMSVPVPVDQNLKINFCPASTGDLYALNMFDHYTLLGDPNHPRIVLMIIYRDTLQHVDEVPRIFSSAHDAHTWVARKRARRLAFLPPYRSITLHPISDYLRIAQGVLQPVECAEWIRHALPTLLPCDDVPGRYAAGVTEDLKMACAWEPIQRVLLSCWWGGGPRVECMEILRLGADTNGNYFRELGAIPLEVLGKRPQRFATGLVVLSTLKNQQEQQQHILQHYFPLVVFSEKDCMVPLDRPGDLLIWTNVKPGCHHLPDPETAYCLTAPKVGESFLLRFFIV